MRFYDPIVETISRLLSLGHTLAMRESTIPGDGMLLSHLVTTDPCCINEAIKSNPKSDLAIYSIINTVTEERYIRIYGLHIRTAPDNIQGEYRESVGQFVSLTDINAAKFSRLHDKLEDYSNYWTFRNYVVAYRIDAKEPQHAWKAVSLQRAGDVVLFLGKQFEVSHNFKAYVEQQDGSRLELFIVVDGVYVDSDRTKPLYASSNRWIPDRLEFKEYDRLDPFKDTDDLMVKNTPSVDALMLKIDQLSNMKTEEPDSEAGKAKQQLLRGIKVELNRLLLCKDIGIPYTPKNPL